MIIIQLRNLDIQIHRIIYMDGVESERNYGVELSLGTV